MQPASSTGGFVTTATGTFDTPLVKESDVDAYTSKAFDASLFAGAALLFGGATLASIGTLVAGVKHPVGVYILLAAEGALTVAFGTLAVWKHIARHKARDKLRKAAMLFQTTFSPTPQPATESSGTTDPAREAPTSAAVGPLVAIPEAGESNTEPEPDSAPQA